ncbi:PKD domain-containing protein [Methanofollis ethanolicus]|uniref:PKD domain-containing protein n=1 Tax=Methanofollis ethanolicus TaxID=488124 RepID=UPI00082DD969|nr:PKD domain-containing protein [Methanofollis ethanolicus]
MASAAAPTADFTAGPTAGTAPLAVSFTDHSTGDPTGWAWFFGDEDYTEPWTEVTGSAGWPACDSSAAAALPNGHILVMGGTDDNGYPQNDTWRSTNGGETWTKVNASSGWTGRYNPAAVALPDGSVIIMGGMDVHGYPQNDTWRSTDEGTTWEQLPNATWTGREGSAAVALSDGSVLVMGGYYGYPQIYLNDTWRSTDKGATWEQLPNAGWSAREGMKAVALPDGSVIVMGGGYGGYPETCLNDTWRSTDGGETWTEMTDSAGWTARYGSAAAALPDGSVIVMGGYDGYSVSGDPINLNDVWRSTDRGTTWEQLPSANWTARYGSTAAALPDGSVIVMGGAGSPTNLMNDVWRFQPEGSNEQDPNHTYASAGTYTVTLQAYNNDGAMRATENITVPVLIAPTASFTADPISGTAPLTVTFNDTSAGKPTGWSWNFGDGIIATGQNQTHTYEDAGTYTVSLTVENGAGTNASSQAITVLPPPPTAAFTADPTTGTAPLAVSFTDTSAGDPSGRAWFFGDENYTEAWTEVTDSAGWSKRFRHAAAALPDGSVIIMGGCDGSNYLNDTWRSTNGGETWTKVNASAGWTVRDGHAAVALPDGSVIIMGGCDGSGNYLNDTWRSTNGGTTWTEVNASAGWPARDGHAAVALPDGSVIVMGGYDGNNCLNDTWRSTNNGKTWEQVPNANWTARYGSAAVALPDGHVLVMGGDSGNYLNDTWRSTDGGTTWTEVNASAGWSARKYLAAVALPDGSVLVMGGYDDSCNDRNDVWRSTDEGETWEQLPDANWTERESHAAVTLPDGSVIIMGGCWYDGDKNNYLNDVWRFQPEGSNEQNPTHTYESAGTYTVTLQAYNDGGATRATGNITVAVPVAPTAAFNATPTDGNAPLTVNFTDNSVGDPTSWSWNFGDGTNSTGQNQTHTYTVPGTYTVSLNASNAHGFNVSTVTDAVRVLPAPVAGLTFTPTDGNAPLTVNFSDSSTGNVTAWAWDFGDGTNSTEQNPNHTYTVPGTYTVSLNASNVYGFNVSTVSDAVAALAPPVAGFTFTPTDGNAPLNVTFSDNSTGNVTAWTWNFGDGTNSTEQNATHTYTVPGTYTVSLNASNTYAFNVSTIAEAVRVLPAPVAGFTFNPTEGNAPLTVNFSDNSTGNVTARLWDFGDGTTSIEQNATHTYAVPGTYTVSLNASNTYGFNVSTIADAVVALAPPVAGFTFTPTDGNAPLNVTFTDNSTGNVTAWAWNFGDGTNSTGQNPNHIYTVPGTYNVSLNASNAHGFNVSTVTDAVRVLPAPIAGFTFTPTEGNAPLSVTFSDNSTGNVTAWAWNFGDGTNSTGQNPNHTYTVPGTYTVSLNASNVYGFNVSTVTDAVVALAPPVAGFTFTPTDGNAPLNVTFTDNSTGNVTAWAWNFGDGTTSIEQNPNHTYASAGTYTVSLNASNAYAFNVSTIAEAVRVLPAPIAGFTFNPTEGNAPLNVTFSDNSTGNVTAWAWDFGDGTTSIEQNPNHTYASAGTYTVSLNASNVYGFNVSTIAEAVHVLPAPIAGFTFTPTEGNAPLNVTFSDNSTGNVTAWAWNFGDGTNSTEQNPNHSYASAGTYTVSLNASNVYGFNVSTVTDAVHVLPAPVAGFTFTPTEGNAPLNVTFSDNSTGNVTAWAWNFGDGTNSTEQNATHTYTVPGTYTVTLNASNTYGLNVSTANITVSSPSSHSGSSSGGSSNLAARSASNIPAGGDASLTFSGQAIYGIGVTAGESIPNLLVTIGESSLPSNVTAPAETVYEYDEVTLYHTTDDAIESASLLFTVPKTWLEENNLDPADVVLYRYHDGEWQALPTEAASEDATSWHFSAQSPGFCLFAIGGDRTTPAAVETTSAGAQAGTTETTQPVTTVETTSTPTEAAEPFPITLLICGAAVLIVTAFVLRKRG